MVAGDKARVWAVSRGILAAETPEEAKQVQYGGCCRWELLGGSGQGAVRMLLALFRLETGCVGVAMGTLSRFAGCKEAHNWVRFLQKDEQPLCSSHEYYFVPSASHQTYPIVRWVHRA